MDTVGLIFFIIGFIIIALHTTKKTKKSVKAKA